MEEPSRQNGKPIDITDLIADSEELYQDLKDLQELDRDKIIEELDTAIEPYVQLAERGVEDKHTGMDLYDIWRYFRYTWLTPYNQVPGRNINFLIRDASREHHPIMGIASLASSMMNPQETRPTHRLAGRRCRGGTQAEISNVGNRRATPERRAYARERDP